MADNDRISYSFGMKVPGKEAYSSIDFHVSMSTDVQLDETTEDAYIRARAFVKAKSKAEYQAINVMRGKIAKEK